MKPLIISLSGVRGIVGENLTPDVLSKLAASFGIILHGGKVVVATDSRVSREMCLDAVISGLISSGSEVINLGISPTPSLQIMIRELNARGGICITASHNPPEWNGLKFYNSEAILLSSNLAKKLLSTTKAIDDVAEKFGCRCLRTKVGEINVVEGMKRAGAVIGGEGNGGVIFPSVHYGRDRRGPILEKLRSSLLRITAEAKTKKKASQIYGKVVNLIQG